MLQSIEDIIPYIAQSNLKKEDSLEEDIISSHPLVDDNLESEIQEVKNIQEPSEHDNLSYSFAHEQLLSQNSSVDYDKLWYGESPKQGKFEPEDDYWVVTAKTNDTESMVLSAEEAEDTFTDIQFAAATGQYHSVDWNTMRKFDLWIKFNPAMFAAFEQSYSMTREVNYSAPV
jgi:hypothetical protein